MLTSRIRRHKGAGSRVLLKGDGSATAPFRLPLLTVPGIRERAASLAGKHLFMKPAPVNILQYLEHNEKALEKVYAHVADLSRREIAMIAAGECLLNNIHLIEGQILKDKERIRKNPGADLARVYDIAAELVACTDGQVDQALVETFISAYQEVTVLKLIELRLLHVVVRAVLVENIKRIATRAGYVKVTGNHEETETQTKDYVSLWNSVRSLQLLAVVEWRKFVEAQSIVDQLLSRDPAGIYRKMDIYTRQHYRSVVQKIAAAGRLTEEEVAYRALAMAEGAATPEGGGARAHVGHYLCGAGYKQLMQEAGARLSWIQHILRDRPVGLYLATITIVVLTVAGGLSLKAYTGGLSGWLLPLTIIILLLCVLQPVVSAINWLMAFATTPELLPRMDFADGIPSDARTLVIVPAMISSEAVVDELLNALELRFLGNRSDHLHFGLLTDYEDAQTEKCEADERLLQRAKDGVEGLNIKYGRYSHDLFFLFHRSRKWNAADKIWMGYERKRGKLEALNAFLRGRAKDSFAAVIGKQEIFPEIKYIITLDADTQLPRDTAWKMIGAMAHPLNRPCFDEEQLCVTSGYGVLQPRISVEMPTANKSAYARMYGQNAGIDPYTRALPDFYQDAFGEGSFIGKGIYDVDICIKVLEQRFPENRILSHDLLEGCLLRSGLLSDVSLYEDLPSGYHIDIQRRHRWIRGDWQIAAWLLPFVPAAGARFARNSLNALSRWKIFDNLCRSLYPLSLLILCVLSWTLLEGAFFWTSTILALMFFPCVTSFAEALIKSPARLSFRKNLTEARGAAGGTAMQILAMLICLPCEAYYATDAILRVGCRLLLTKKKLLEWNQSANLRKEQKKLVDMYLLLWPCSFISAVILVYVAFYVPFNLLLACPFLTLWVAAPFLAWKTALHIKPQRPEFSVPQRAFLRKLARRTWCYFETFTGPRENWLPPDHYQEYPEKRVAHWTSPTNLGLTLLSNLSAYDFGYITAAACLERVSGTLRTMKKMERYRGHFYNWYDTTSCRPAFPLYVSTVDSGNLIGHLLTLRQGLLGMLQQKTLGPALFIGLQDEFDLIEEDAGAGVQLEPVRQLLKEAMSLQSPGFKDFDIYTTRLSYALLDLKKQLNPNPGSNADKWFDLIQVHLQQIRDELELCAPWLYLLPAELHSLLQVGEGIPPLCELEGQLNVLSQVIRQYQKSACLPDGHLDLGRLGSALARSAGIIRERIGMVYNLAAQCKAFTEVEYDFLYDEQRDLLSIGYRPEQHQRDIGYYDLLASEARLGIFVAIAQGRLPQKSWFSLGRQVVNAADSYALLSWNGTMFEYLMPMLVMPDYEHTLLHQTMRSVVRRHIDYGNENGIPWGMSECAHGLIEASLSYKYKAAGVPGLAVKRGVEKELVIAPYASVLALMVDPAAAYENLELLAMKGFLTQFGFYEAIDYLPGRFQPGESCSVVRSFMVHHQGMSLLALGQVLLDKPMQQRFEADKKLRSALLLLQEKMSKEATFHLPPMEKEAIKAGKVEGRASDAGLEEGNMPYFKQDPLLPQVQWLSNGRYRLMINDTGGNSSRWKHLAVTPWASSAAEEHTGICCYVRDTGTGVGCHVTHRWPGDPAKRFSVKFSPGQVLLQCRQDHLETSTTIFVSPEEDLEARMMTIRNNAAEQKVIEVVGYAKVMLSLADAEDSRHSFNKLFVHTHILPAQHAIICTQSPSKINNPAASMFWVMKACSGSVDDITYETDGMQFRYGSLEGEGRLSNSQGIMLDTIVAIKYRVRLNPSETVKFNMIMGAGETEDACRSLIGRCQEPRFTGHELLKAKAHQQSILKQMNAIASDVNSYMMLANQLFYSSAGTGDTLAKADLNDLGIIGNLPIVVLYINESSGIGSVRQLVQAHLYWQYMGVAANLVILQEDNGCYDHFLKQHIVEIIINYTGAEPANQPGGIYLLSGSKLQPEKRKALKAAATLIVDEMKRITDHHSYRTVELEPSTNPAEAVHL